MSWPDWGNVPSWAASGSLFLAFSLFIRDRRERRRHQVEQVGVWVTLEREKTDGKLYLAPMVHVTNGSKLPVELAKVSYVIEYRWLVLRGGKVTDRSKLRREVRRGVVPFTLAPETTQEITGRKVKITGSEPGVGLVLDPVYRARVDLVLIADNSGKRWRVLPGSGKPARRHRWHHSYSAVLRNPIQHTPWKTERLAKLQRWINSRRRTTEAIDTPPVEEEATEEN